jgi:hypothetical protein
MIDHNRMHMSEFSLIIADDHPLMRTGIKEVVSADRLFNLVDSLKPVASAWNWSVGSNRMLPWSTWTIPAPTDRKSWMRWSLQNPDLLICFLTEDENQVSTNLFEAAKDGTTLFVNERLPNQLRARLRDVAINLARKKGAAGLPSPATLPVDDAFSRRLTPRQNQIVAMLKVGSTNRIGVANRTQLAAQCFAAR